MITVIDNYDSFTYNLVQQIERLSGERTNVIRNDAFGVGELINSKPTAIVISPGPGVPKGAGHSMGVARSSGDIPLLGICLGHQVIAESFGSKIIRGSDPVHGKTNSVHHEGVGLFENCESPLQGARYHSLVIDPESIPEMLRVDARTDDGAIMAISHRDRPIFGVQFHPESYGTLGGDELIRNFLRLGGLS